MIIIFTRFSVLTREKKFQHFGETYHARKGLPALARRIVSRKPVAPDKAGLLYSDSRMKFRFACFETVTLPSLAAQTDRDFHHVVLYSEVLPKQWKSRLAALQKDNGFHMTAMAEDMTFQAAYQEAAATLLRSTPSSGWIATVRLDDDDALNVGYCKQIRNLASSGSMELAVSSYSGVELTIGKGPPEMRPYKYMFSSVGLAFIEQISADIKTVGSLGPHTHIYERKPVLILPERNVFLQTTHVHNDSYRFSNRKLKKADVVKEAGSLLMDNFGIDLGRVTASLQPD